MTEWISNGIRKSQLSLFKLSKILHTASKVLILNTSVRLLRKEDRAKNSLPFYQTAVVFQNQSLKVGNKPTKPITEVLQHWKMSSSELKLTQILHEIASSKVENHSSYTAFDSVKLTTNIADKLHFYLPTTNRQRSQKNSRHQSKIKDSVIRCIPRALRESLW